MAFDDWKPIMKSAILGGPSGERICAVFHAASPTHMQNLGLLAGTMPGVRFRVFYRSQEPWSTPEAVKQYPYEHFFDLGNSPPPALFTDGVRGIILSMVGAYPWIADLIEFGLRLQIPIFAIEEVNQLALNGGVINHYLLPVDHLFVASEYERNALVELGLNPTKVYASGWPFYSGLQGGLAAKSRQQLLLDLGVPEGRPVATLCLSQIKQAAHSNSLETYEVRRQILELVSRGTPDQYALLVKLHPTEDFEQAQATIRPLMPSALIVPGRVSISDVLEITDVCLNRGNSQVVVEAIRRGLPVLAIPCGIRTLFDELASQAVIRTSEDLRTALEYIAGGGQLEYANLSRVHFPIPPTDALVSVCDTIQSVLHTGQRDDTTANWFDLVLYRGLLRQRGLALRLLEEATRQFGTLPSTLPGLRRLLLMEATARDVEDLLGLFHRPYQRPLVISLWIEQLYTDRIAREADLRIVEREGDFPPKFNSHSYVEHAVMLAYLYYGAKKAEAAQHVLSLLKDFVFLGSVRTAYSAMGLAVEGFQWN